MASPGKGTHEAALTRSTEPVLGHFLPCLQVAILQTAAKAKRTCTIHFGCGCVNALSTVKKMTGGKVLGACMLPRIIHPMRRGGLMETFT
eukprot:102039-Pelagomonas_calceolata.AAC.2